MSGRGRHHERPGGRRVADIARRAREAAGPDEPPVEVTVGFEAGPGSGPYDEEDAPHDDADRLDLGSVRLPVPDGSRYEVAVDQDGVVRAVHLLTDRGRLTVVAFAAPRSGGLWTEWSAEIAERLRAGGATVDLLRGEWGRELHATTGTEAQRLIGVDGPRWLLRAVAAGPVHTHRELVEQLYRVLRGTVVVRGPEPLPVRSPLPVTLPEQMAEQLKQFAAAWQEQQGQQGQQPGG